MPKLNAWRKDAARPLGNLDPTLGGGALGLPPRLAPCILARIGNGCFRGVVSTFNHSAPSPRAGLCFRTEFWRCRTTSTLSYGLLAWFSQGRGDRGHQGNDPSRLLNNYQLCTSPYPLDDFSCAKSYLEARSFRRAHHFRRGKPKS